MIKPEKKEDKVACGSKKKNVIMVGKQYVVIKTESDKI